MKKSHNARSIILDCDPGHDDTVAIMLALGNDAIDLRGITTVAGNQTVEKTTRNALSVLMMCNREDVPVHMGADRPLVRDMEIAPSIHGESGLELDGFELPAPSREPDTGHAALYIIDEVMASEPGTLTLVGTGAATNIALACRLEPRIIPRVREVVLMHGGVHIGNWAPVAEFNTLIDPEAAHIVFEAEWPLTMVGLNLTHQALVTEEFERRVAEGNTELSQFFVSLISFFRRTYKREQNFDNPPIHDPCTIAYLIDPSVVRTRKAPIHVELQGALTTGMSVADIRLPAPDSCRTQFATTLDHDGFSDLVVNAIRALE